MAQQSNPFWAGVRDGIPICLGYLSVAFAFGIFSVGQGLRIWEALLISMTNVTSAGQLAAVPIMVSGGTAVELALTEFIINLRYFFCLNLVYYTLEYCRFAFQFIYLIVLWESHVNVYFFLKFSTN